MNIQEKKKLIDKATYSGWDWKNGDKMINIFKSKAVTLILSISEKAVTWTLYNHIKKISSIKIIDSNTTIMNYTKKRLLEIEKKEEKNHTKLFWDSFDDLKKVTDEEVMIEIEKLKKKPPSFFQKIREYLINK